MNMKRSIVVMLVLAVLLCGCRAAPGPQQSETAQTAAGTGSGLPGQREETQTSVSSTEAAVTAERENEPASQTEPETEAASQTEPVDPYSLLGESLFEQGTYTDAVGNTWTYSFALPCLKAETPGAEAINTAIDERFGAMVRETHEAMEQSCSLTLVHVGYNTFFWNGILTLEILVHNDWEFDEYGVFCYEVATGQWLDTRALLARLDVEEEAFLAAVRAEALRTFDARYEMVPEIRENEDYQRSRAWTASEEAVNLDMMAFPDNEGNIQVVAPIGSLAGAAYYYEVITPALAVG